MHTLIQASTHLVLVAIALMSCESSSKRVGSNSAEESASASGAANATSASGTILPAQAIVAKSNDGGEAEVGSALSERCLKGDDDACDLVLAGIPNAEGAEWAGATAALCKAGASTYCLEHDRAAEAAWQAGCAKGVYLACKSAGVLLIEKGRMDSAPETSDAARQRFRMERCLGAESARSMTACYDLVTDIKEAERNRARGYAVLTQACAGNDTAACGLVAKTHTSLLRQAELPEVIVGERSTATRLEQAHAADYGAVLTRLAASCEQTDWAACGFCGDRRRGYLTHDGEYVDQAVREAALAAKVRQSCDALWRVGAMKFRDALMAKH